MSMAPKVPLAGERYWNVVFLRRSRSERWWDRLSPAWCRHVLCFSYEPSVDAWLMVDPIEPRTVVSLQGNEQLQACIAAWKADGAVWCRVCAEGVGGYDHRWLQTCSSIVARVVGVRGGAWRPIALARSLASHSTYEVMHDPHQCLSKQNLQRPILKLWPAKRRRPTAPKPIARRRSRPF